MRKRFRGKTLLCLMGCMLFLAGWLLGKEMPATQKTIIHAGAWTALPTLTPEQFENFRKETAAKLAKVPGMKRVWVGKLREPVTVEGIRRDYGLVFEFDSLKNAAAWSTNRPPDWYADFNKLRKPDSTRFDVVGE